MARSILSRIFAQRQTRDPRYPDEGRIPYTGRTVAGEYITPDRALQNPVVWACNRYITQSVGSCPWKVLREQQNGDHERMINHPVDYLLSTRVSPEWAPFQFKETMVSWALMRGNGVAEIELDMAGRLAALHPIQPWRIEFERDPVNGDLLYEVDNGSGAPKTTLRANQVFHLRGFGDGPVGLSVVEYAAQTIGWAQATMLFGAGLFGNGLNVSGIVKNKAKLNEAGLKRQRMELDQLHGGPRKANRYAILDGDSDFEAITIEPDKAQFIATMQHQVEELCRWFGGVPPHMVQHLLRSTNNNIEHQSIEAIQNCIAPWAIRLEQEANYKLFGQNRTRLKTTLELKGLLRGDSAARAALYRALRELGAISPNEIRRLEDMNGIGSQGDVYMVQGQYMTLEEILRREAAPAPQPQPPAPDPLDPAADPDETRAARALIDMATEFVHAP